MLWQQNRSEVYLKSKEVKLPRVFCHLQYNTLQYIVQLSVQYNEKELSLKIKHQLNAVSSSYAINLLFNC